MPRRLTISPAPAVGATLNANAARQANHDNTVLKVNADSRKAMGILMGPFNPDSNAHHSLIGWFNEPLVGLTALQMRRKDFNFRNVFEKWQTEYKPNKQFNYDEPLARVCAVGPGCKQAENRNKENPKKRWEFQGRIRYNPAGMLGG